MDRIAQRYHCRPSAIAGIGNNWEAYQFDSAVGLLGAWVDGQLAERDEDGRLVNSVESVLFDKQGVAPKRKFRDPITGKIIEG